MAGSELQRDGAMKLKEHCPNDLNFCFGILSSFSLEDVPVLFFFSDNIYMIYERQLVLPLAFSPTLSPRLFILILIYEP